MDHEPFIFMLVVVAGVGAFWGLCSLSRIADALQEIARKQ